MSVVDLGQVWVHNVRHSRHRVIEIGTTNGREDVKLLNCATRRTHWIYAFTLARFYTREVRDD